MSARSKIPDPLAARSPSAMTDLILKDQDGAVLTLTLNAPEYVIQK